jgi:phage terminase Nu1 subunit (DNA packaging protein)
MDERHIEFLKTEIARTMNVAAGVGRKLPDYLDEYFRLTDG